MGMDWSMELLKVLLKNRYFPINRRTKETFTKKKTIIFGLLAAEIFIQKMIRTRDNRQAYHYYPNKWLGMRVKSTKKMAFVNVDGQ